MTVSRNKYSDNKRNYIKVKNYIKHNLLNKYYYFSYIHHTYALLY